MLLSDNFLHYLNSSSHILDCGIIITDLSKVIYANTSSLYSSFNTLEECNYASKQISKDLTKIISKWSKFQYFNDNMFEMYNYTEKDIKSVLKLTKDDKVSYYAQLVLPIFRDNKLTNLFICFRTNRHYINSSVKPVITTRNFIENYLNDNYILGVS